MCTFDHENKINRYKILVGRRCFPNTPDTFITHIFVLGTTEKRVGGYHFIIVHCSYALQGDSFVAISSPLYRRPPSYSLLTVNDILDLYNLAYKT